MKQQSKMHSSSTDPLSKNVNSKSHRNVSMIPITLLNRAMEVEEVVVEGLGVVVEGEDVDLGVVEGEALGGVVVVAGVAARVASGESMHKPKAFASLAGR